MSTQHHHFAFYLFRVMASQVRQEQLKPEEGRWPEEKRKTNIINLTLFDWDHHPLLRVCSSKILYIYYYTMFVQVSWTKILVDHDSHSLTTTLLICNFCKKRYDLILCLIYYYKIPYCKNHK